MNVPVQMPVAKPSVIQRLFPVVLLVLGIACLIVGAWLWFSQPAKPVSIEGNLRPVGFSLGLDDPDLLRIDRQGASTFWKGDGRTFPNGFAEGARRAWPGLEVAAGDPSMSPVKVIPSGGLYPYYRFSSFAEEISSFVHKGGSLICMGQPLGGVFRALPGSPEGVGWAEMGQDPKTAVGDVSPALDHPALSANDDAEWEAHFAGFFTSVPGGDTANVLLRDADTGRPVLIAYRYGAGLVIAGTLISDYAAGEERATPQETVLLRQLLSWAQAGGVEIPMFEPGGSAEMTYVFRKGQGADVDCRVELYNPWGKLEDSFSMPLPEDGSEVSSRYQAIGEEMGIWRMVTYRRDAQGKASGPVTSSWFSAGHAPVPNEPGRFRCTVTVPGPYLATGAKAAVGIYLWNDSATDMEVIVGGPVGKHTVRLAAGKEKTIRDEVPMEGLKTRVLEYRFYGGNGMELATVQRRIETGPPDRVFMTLKASGKPAGSSVVVSTLSVNPGRFEAECTLCLTGSGKVLWQEVQTMALSGAVEKKVEVPIPADASGRLVLEAVMTHDGREVARSWVEIDTER